MVTFNGNSLLIGDLFSPICVKHFSLCKAAAVFVFLLIVLFRCLVTVEKNKNTQGNTTKKKFVKSKKASVLLQLMLFLLLKTRKFLLSHSRVACVVLEPLDYFIRQNEIRKKNVEYYARPLRGTKTGFSCIFCGYVLASSSPYIFLYIFLLNFLCISLLLSHNFNS